MRHTYHLAGQIFGVGLEVQDARGGRTLWNGKLDLPETLEGAPTQTPEIFFQEARECGCGGMTIRHHPAPRSRLSRPYCIARENADDYLRSNPDCQPAPAPIGLCAPNEISFACFLGPRRPLPAVGQNPFGFRFEVTAALTPGSTAALCEEGQYARANATVNGGPVNFPPTRPEPRPAGGLEVLPRESGAPFAFPVVPAGAPYPDVNGDSWGADGYVRPFGFKRYFDRTIQWLDRPAVGSDSPINTAALTAEFVAFLRGTPGENTCWCRFRIELGFDGGISGPGFTPQDKSRCNFSMTNEELLAGDRVFDPIDTALWGLINDSDLISGPEGAYPPTAPPGQLAMAAGQRSHRQGFDRPD